MKHRLNLCVGLLGLALLLLSATLRVSGAGNQVYFASDPSLTSDGKTIVFAYEDDLWEVPAEGGSAWRLTGMAGRESSPRFSPDGKWIAFTGRQDGNANIYIIPTGGGDIKQLTYHEGVSTAESWSWDSKYIYFTGDAYNSMTTYKIAVTGGTPLRLFPNYFNWPHCMIENPKTKEWYFTDSWESSRFANRKRYKGSFNPDIKSWNPKTKEYKVHTTYNGKDLWPTIDENGTVYYVSDQLNNEYNLYRLDEGDKPVSLTNFTTSIKQPQVDAKGDKIVFEKDYQIFLYDVSSGKSAAVAIQLPANNTLSLEESFNITGRMTAADLSPDEKKLAFVCRGELFVSDVEGKFIHQIKVEGPGRVIEVKWMADNLTLVYSKTVGGWPNWFKIKAYGDEKEEQLTDVQQSNRMLALNKKRTFGVYLSGRDELRKLDLETGKSETLVKDEFWGIENSAPTISPDEQYVAYTVRRNFEQDIYLYNLSEKKAINLTNTAMSEDEPAWSPDGKYMYFTTDREHPEYPYGFENAKIYRIALNKYETDFKEDRYDRLFTKEEKQDSAAKIHTNLGMNDIEDRWEQITNAHGNQGSAFVINKKDETMVYYISNQDGDGNFLWRWSKKTFEKPDTKKIDGGVSDGDMKIIQGKSKCFVVAGGNLYELDADAAKLKKIDMAYTFSRSLDNEFNEMFYETWANLDENYYDENFHGVDWLKMRTKYEAYLPYLKSRGSLRILLNDMLGELNSSHQGFYSMGDEEKLFYSSKTMATGIMFDDNSPYKVKYVVHNSPADMGEKDIKEGDVLYAVDGEKVDESENIDRYFSRPTLPDEVMLTFKRHGELVSVKIHPEAPLALKTQLYDEWINNNQKFVDEKSGKRIAYIQMKDMGGESLEKFMIKMGSEAYNRDGLILDLRYNTGGNVHDEVLRFLSQKPYLNWKYRDGKITSQPNFYPASKPIVLLVNEQTLSDGEMTSAGFQALKLGTIVGTETYRWIIFTSSKTMVDGSTCRMPSWGCYKLNGDDIEKTGVTPDIQIQNTIQDRTEGKDPQLEKAIEVVMGQMK